MVEHYGPDSTVGDAPTDQERSAAPAGPRARAARRVPEFQGVRTGEMVYVEYATRERELYDLQKDPYELENLAAGAARDLLARLAARLAELRRCAGATCRTAEDAPTGQR